MTYDLCNKVFDGGWEAEGRKEYRKDEMRNKIKKQDVLNSGLLLFVFVLLFNHCSSAVATEDGSNLGQAQIDWIISMQDPITGFVDSYQDDGKVNAYIFDQALAIIALADVNKTTEAQSILDRMQNYQRDDPNGAWYVAYRVGVINPDWPPGDCYYYRTGDIAWMVIAINFYEWKTGDPNYAQMARRALGWMDTMRNTDPNDGKYGSLRYCDGCGIWYAVSTEHNIDAYSAYYWRGILDGNETYLNTAGLISDYLVREMWGPTPGSNCSRNGAVFCRGYNDPVIATDCQCWGVLSLGILGPGRETFYKSLYWLLDSELQTTCDYNESIIDVNGLKSETNESRDYVRVDVTDSVAAAFYSIGVDAWGDYFHNEMKRIVDANGGLVHSFYCNPSDPWIDIYQYNYVASAAWHYFNEAGLNPFVLRPSKKECQEANINETGRVNWLDFAILASDWRESDSGFPGDVNKDKAVNWWDVFILWDYWLSHCE